MEKRYILCLDRLIQGKKIYTNWTSLNDIFEYNEIINQIQNEQNKAIWELEEYNAILRKSLNPKKIEGVFEFNWKTK